MLSDPFKYKKITQSSFQKLRDYVVHLQGLEPWTP